MNRYFPIGHPDALPPEAHVISSARAREMMQIPINPSDPWKMVLFRAEAFNLLMAQEGAVGVGVIPVNNGEHNTVMHVALNSAGEPMLGPDNIVIENGQRCPPLCPEA